MVESEPAGEAHDEPAASTPLMGVDARRGYEAVCREVLDFLDVSLRGATPSEAIPPVLRTQLPADPQVATSLPRMIAALRRTGPTGIEAFLDARCTGPSAGCKALLPRVVDDLAMGSETELLAALERALTSSSRREQLTSFDLERSLGLLAISKGDRERARDCFERALAELEVHPFDHELLQAHFERSTRELIDAAALEGPGKL